MCVCVCGLHCSSGGGQSASCPVVVGLLSSAVKQQDVEVTMQGTVTVNAMKAYRRNRCKATLVPKLGIGCERSASQPSDH